MDNKCKHGILNHLPCPYCEEIREKNKKIAITNELWRDDYDDLEKQNAELKLAVRELGEALDYYAKGGDPSKEHPYKEFGCGCCASSVKYDENGEYENDHELTGSEVQGKVAKDALTKHADILKRSRE